MELTSILFVCTANICRSPMAEYLLKELVRKDPPVSGVSLKVSSAGTSGITGMDASDQALQVMRERKIDMSRHKSRIADEDILNDSDFILCMESAHVFSLVRRFPVAASRVHLLTEFCGANGEITDPSGRPTSVYEECARQIENLTTLLLRKLP